MKAKYWHDNYILNQVLRAAIALFKISDYNFGNPELIYKINLHTLIASIYRYKKINKF